MHETLSLSDGLRLSGLSDQDLWNRYLVLGGNSEMADMRRHVDSGDCPSQHDHNIIALALNESFLERGHDHPVAYAHLYRRGDEE